MKANACNKIPPRFSSSLYWFLTGANTKLISEFFGISECTCPILCFKASWTRFGRSPSTWLSHRTNSVSIPSRTYDFSSSLKAIKVHISFRECLATLSKITKPTGTTSLSPSSYIQNTDISVRSGSFLGHSTSISYKEMATKTITNAIDSNASTTHNKCWQNARNTATPVPGPTISNGMRAASDDGKDGGGRRNRAGSLCIIWTSFQTSAQNSSKCVVLHTFTS